MAVTMSAGTRTPLTTISTRAWWTAVIYVAAVAMLLRFYDLPLKPLHHDEGVNTLILTPLVQPGHTYRYDPANYHGPTLYYFGWLSTVLFGFTTVAIRMVTATAGFLVVLLILGLKRPLGAASVISASALMAVSPGAVYFSRYYIHEMLLVCFTLAVIVFAWNWWNGGRTLPLMGAAASAALMLATKETALISAVVVGGAASVALLLARIGQRTVGPRLTSPLRKPPMVAAVAAATVFIGVALLFYTSLFSHWQGAVDAVRTFAFWTKTGTSAHTHSWPAYLDWLRAEEMPLLLVGIPGIVVALWRRDNPLAVFAALWALGMFAAYSAIPYKTPWLVLNVILPLAIVGGYACEFTWSHRRKLPRGVLITAFAALLGFATYHSVVLNFVEYDDGTHPYVYAHTHRDVLRLVDDIHTIESRHPRSSIAVTSRDHFPLSWYLRAYPAGYYGREVVTGDPLVIASADQQPYFDRSLGGEYQRVGVYRLRPGVRLVLYVRLGLRE